MGDRDDRRFRIVPVADEHLFDVERHTLGPRRERRGRQKTVELQRQLGPLSRREERIEVDDTELAHGWVLDERQQPSEVEVDTVAPRSVDQVGQQHVLTARERIGLDAHETQEATDQAVDLVAEGLLVGVCPGRVQVADDVQRHAGGRARCVDGEVGRGSQPGDAVLADAGPGEAGLPELGGRRGQLVGGLAVAFSLALVDPWAEVGWGQIGERQQQVPHVALGVDHQRGYSLEQGFFQQTDAQSGLARTGHAHDDAVGGEVGSLVDDPLVDRGGIVVDRVARLGVDDRTQVKVT